MLECSANLACVGAEPLGLTNCLNFGNPEKPHIAWQLTRAVAGLGDACRALGVPVVGGNVSLYNEGGGGPILPTPVVGMVGELPDAARAGQARLRAAGRRRRADRGRGWAPSLTGSELAKLRGEAPEGELPAADLGELRACTRRSARRSARARCAPRTTSPRAASRWRWPSAAWPAVGAEVARTARRRAAVRRGPGRVRRLRPARRVRRVRRGGDGDRRCVVAASLGDRTARSRSSGRGARGRAHDGGLAAPAPAELLRSQEVSASAISSKTAT